MLSGGGVVTGLLKSNMWGSETKKQKQNKPPVQLLKQNKNKANLVNVSCNVSNPYSAAHLYFSIPFRT